MAIVHNVWLRGTKKRIGGTVYYVNKGQTLWRELAPTVTNPRTPAQMSTRVRLANLVQLYKAGRGWMKAAFENKKQTQSDYNAFVSANLANANVYLTKQQVAAGAGVVAPVVITKGSLPPIALIAQGVELISDLKIGNLVDIDEVTVGVLSQALISNNPAIQAGDQISLIQYVQQTGADGTPYVVCRAYEMLIDPTSTAPVTNFMPDYVYAHENMGDNTLAVDSDAPMGGYAFILSRTVGSTIRVSSQSIVLTADNTVFPLFTTQAAYNAAVESYGEGEAIFLSSEGANDISGNQQVTRQIVSVRIGSTTYGPSSSLPRTIAAGSTVSLIFNDVVPAGAVSAASITTSEAGANPEPLMNLTGTGDNIVSGTIVDSVSAPTGSGQYATFAAALDGGTASIRIPFPPSAD